MHGHRRPVHRQQPHVEGLSRHGVEFVSAGIDKQAKAVGYRLVQRVELIDNRRMGQLRHRLPGSQQGGHRLFRMARIEARLRLGQQPSGFGAARHPGPSRIDTVEQIVRRRVARYVNEVVHLRAPIFPRPHRLAPMLTARNRRDLAK